MITDREKIYWGGFSSIRATIKLMEMGLQQGCDRFVVLQGNDWPLKSNAEIHNFFEENSKIEFAKAYDVTVSSRKKSYMKSAGYYLFDGVDRTKISLKTIIARLLSLVNKIGIKYMKGFYFDSNSCQRMDVFWGWAHISLTRDCVAYIVQIFKKNSGLNHYFRRVFPADETYFQTIIYNSPFRERTLDGNAVNELDHLDGKSMLNLTYFEYIPGRVRIFTSPEELKNINLEKYLFIRKVSEEFVSKCSKQS